MNTELFKFLNNQKLIFEQFSTQNTQNQFRILGNNEILNLFTIDKHTGQLFIKDTMALDVNHLNTENIYFSVEVCHLSIFNID